MAHVSYGTVNVGGKTIELKGVSGTVAGKSTSSETTTTVDQSGRVVGSRTDSYVEFLLESPDRDQYPVAVSSHQANVRNGDTATAFWGEVRGKESGWLAVYNHNLDSLRFVASSRNDLAGPLPYNWLLIGAVIAIVAGVGRLLVGAGGFGSVISVIAGVAMFVWILRRRKTLTDFVASTVASLKSKGGASAATMASAAANR